MASTASFKKSAESWHSTKVHFMYTRVSPVGGASFSGSVTEIDVGSCRYCSVASLAAVTALPPPPDDSPPADDPPFPLLEQPVAATTTIASDASDPFNLCMTLPSERAPAGIPPQGLHDGEDWSATSESASSDADHRRRSPARRHIFT